MTEYGDRINQLDVNVTKTFKIGRMTIQPKLDVFNLLNVAPVFDVRSLLLRHGCLQPAVGSVLNPRTIPARRGRSLLAACGKGDSQSPFHSSLVRSVSHLTSKATRTPCRYLTS